MGNFSGGLNFFTYPNVGICNYYSVSDILKTGVEFSRQGKNSLGGVKILQVGTSETIKCLGSNS